MRKILQRKSHYVCRCCQREQAVIIGLGAAHKYKFNSEKRISNHVGYHPTYKIYLCLRCRTVYRITSSNYFNWLVRVRLGRWAKTPIYSPTIERIKGAIADQCNLREVIAFEKENCPDV